MPDNNENRDNRELNASNFLGEPRPEYQKLIEVSERGSMTLPTDYTEYFMIGLFDKPGMFFKSEGDGVEDREFRDEQAKAFTAFLIELLKENGGGTLINLASGRNTGKNSSYELIERGNPAVVFNVDLFAKPNQLGDGQEIGRTKIFGYEMDVLDFVSRFNPKDLPGSGRIMIMVNGLDYAIVNVPGYHEALAWEIARFTKEGDVIFGNNSEVFSYLNRILSSEEGYSLNPNVRRQDELMAKFFVRIECPESHLNQFFAFRRTDFPFPENN